VVLISQPSSMDLVSPCKMNFVLRDWVGLELLLFSLGLVSVSGLDIIRERSKDVIWWMVESAVYLQLLIMPGYWFQWLRLYCRLSVRL